MAITFSRTVEITPEQKPGRNDPCRCGSGKKYKKCCLAKDEGYNPALKSGYVSRVVDWLHQKQWFTDTFNRELERLYGGRQSLEENELHMVMEAVIFEVKVKGVTPLEHFLNEAELSEPDRSYFKSWHDQSLFSFFEVINVSLGRSVEIMDIFDRKTYHVFEKMGAYSLEKGMVIAARIIPFENDWMFSGTGLSAFPEEAMYILKRELEEHRLDRITELEYINIYYGNNNSEESISNLSFEETRRLLVDEIQKHGIDFDVEEYDRLIGETKAIDFGPVIQKFGRKCSSQKEFEYLTNLLYSMHQKHPRYQNAPDSPGPKERILVSQMMHELERKHADPKTFSQKWLDVPQKQLGFLTPREAILEERQKLGNPNRKISYSISVTP